MKNGSFFYGRRRCVVFSVGTSIIFMLAAYKANLIATLMHLEIVFELTISVICALLFGLRALSCVRCKRCGLNMFAYAISTESSLSWLDWLLNADVCPRCGYRCCSEAIDRHESGLRNG